MVSLKERSLPPLWLVGTVGMYAVGEVAKKYARQAMENMDIDEEKDLD